MEPVQTTSDAPVSTPPSPTPQEPVSKKQSGIKLFGLGILGVVLLVLLGGYVVVRRGVSAVSQKPAVVTGADIFRVPAAKINGSKISYAEYVRDLQALTNYYKESNITPPGEYDVSNQVLVRLFDNVLIDPLAKQYEVTVTESDVDAEKQQLISEVGTLEKAEEEVKKFYNWDMATYMERIVSPFLLRQKVAQAFVSSTDAFGEKYVDRELRVRHILFPVEDVAKDAAVEKEAEKILARAKAGEDFEKLAKQYTIETEREFGGELPWFTRGRMIPEFEDAAFALQAGDVSDLVQTSYGYHIIKVEEDRTVRSFQLLMDALAREADVKMYIKVPNPFEVYTTSSTPVGE